MNLTTGLLIYVGSWVLSLLIFLRLGIGGVSSIVLALVVGFIILNVVLPPSKITFMDENDSLAILYYLIEIATPLIILIYAIIIAWHDRKYDSYCSV